METSQNIPGDGLTELPLFPLNNVVLFPGMKLPLHIFEERYKAMIGDCSRRDAPFGVLLIKEGQEVGDPAHPFQIGTTARITNVEQLEDGRMNILTQGERRFEVSEIIQQVPHLIGRVRYVADQPGEVSNILVEEVRREFAEFQRHQATIAGGWHRQIDVTQDTTQLFTEVISSLSANVELPRELRQKLLESSTNQQRLEQLLPVLNRGNQIMREHVEKNNPFRGHRLN
jgi:Lon protease-like protein